MEILIKRYDALKQALVTLDESITLLDVPEYQKIRRSLRDSAIQRFEYTIDTFWKFLKLYLEMQNRPIPEPVNSRNVFREALAINIISEKEFEELINAIGQRNLTSHSYEVTAQEIMESIPRSYELMYTIISRLPKF